MGLFAKDQQAAAVGPTGAPTREEFDALRGELTALKRVTAIAVMAVEDASRYEHAGAAGSPRARLGTIAARPDLFKLSELELDQLRGLLAQIEDASDAEREREREVEHARTAPLTFDDWQPGGRMHRRMR